MKRREKKKKDRTEEYELSTDGESSIYFKGMKSLSKVKKK